MYRTREAPPFMERRGFANMKAIECVGVVDGATYEMRSFREELLAIR